MDWISLQARFASDQDFPARTARLMALEAVLDGRQYDVLPYAFACERSGAGEYIPLSESRPSVGTGICRVVVEDSVSLLFSDGHFPMVQGSDPETVQVLLDLIKESHLNEAMLEAATRGSVGSVAVLFRSFGGRPFFDVISTTYLTPEWAPEDSRRLLRVTELFKVRGVDLVAQGYDVDPTKRYWFKRVWDDSRETWFIPTQVTDQARPAVVDDDRSTDHNLGFVPVVWVKNLPGSSLSGPDGACTFAAAIDTVIETDYLLSQAGRGLKYGSDPTLVLKDGGDIGSALPQRSGGAATALILPPEGDAKLLEINGNAAAAVLAHARELRAIALEAVHGNRAHGDRVSGAQSGRALELLCQGLVWLADRLRISYGEGALLTLLRMVCVASTRIPGGIEVKGQRYRKLDPDGLGLRWPDWFAPSFLDRQAQATTLSTLVEAGILSRETALGSIASIYDVEDLAREVDRTTNTMAEAPNKMVEQ